MQLENHNPPNPTHWQGRTTDPSIGVQYWYQAIRLVDLNHISKEKIAILGYACDEGVKRNQGRVGAAKGPTMIRKRLSKVAYHHNEDLIADYGDVICPDGDLERAHQDLSTAVCQIISKDKFLIVLGGGHDIAKGHFLGIRAALGPDKTIGIINLDAHFDLRPDTNGSNSGTPFFEILSNDHKAKYLAIGIQKTSNTKELFSIADQLGVQYQEYEEQISNRLPSQLNTFIDSVDHIYITIDMDGFSAAYAPGVSAPSPIGFTPSFVFQILEKVFASKKVLSCDIAELNPTYDIDQRTATLAARLIDHIVDLKSSDY